MRALVVPDEDGMCHRAAAMPEAHHIKTRCAQRARWVAIVAEQSFVQWQDATGDEADHCETCFRSTEGLLS